MRLLAPLPTALLLLVLTGDVYSSALPSAQSGRNAALTHNNHAPSYFISQTLRQAHHGRGATADRTPPFHHLPRALSPDPPEVDAIFNADALPTPWPLGAAGIVVSFVTGFSNYRFALPEPSRSQQIGWGITVGRSIGFGISAILRLATKDYTVVWSDDFLALFTNVAGVMAADHDYGYKWWSFFGIIAMVVGLCPGLAHLTLSITSRDPAAKHQWAPFLWNNYTCASFPPEQCPHPLSANATECWAPSPEPYNISTIVDSVRFYAWIFAMFVCVGGLLRLFGKGRASIYGRKVQVVLAYIALGFSIALVVTSEISYKQIQKQEALDCRAVTECTDGAPLNCPLVTVVTPYSADGFFKAWTQELKAIDIPSILA